MAIVYPKVLFTFVMELEEPFELCETISQQKGVLLRSALTSNGSNSDVQAQLYENTLVQPSRAIQPY